jgi:hypothetical protein
MLVKKNQALYVIEILIVSRVSSRMPPSIGAFAGAFELRCGANLCRFCFARISDLLGRRP